MTIRFRVQETLADPPETPLTYFGDALRLWLSGGEEFYEDAEKLDPCENADVIAVWGDKSGNGYDATKVSTPWYDEDACNNIGGAVCAGGDGGLAIPYDVILPADDEVWFFGVWKMGGGYREQIYYNRNGVAKFAMQTVGAGGTTVDINTFTTGGDKGATVACDTSDFVCLSIRFKEGVEWRLWRNGVDKGSVDCSGTTWTNYPVEDGSGLFPRSVAISICVEHWAVVGDIGAAGREWAEGYMMSKFNLS